MTKPKSVPKAEPVEAPVVIPEVKATQATVTWRGNSRTYSKDIHGGLFAELAKKFADQYPDAVIVLE